MQCNEYIKSIGVGVTQLNHEFLKEIQWIEYIKSIRVGLSQLYNGKVKIVYAMQWIEYIKSIGVGVTQLNDRKARNCICYELNWALQIDVDSVCKAIY